VGELEEAEALYIEGRGGDDFLDGFTGNDYLDGGGTDSCVGGETILNCES
jgi:Ca2+-binding RTX toxin-like protein